MTKSEGTEAICPGSRGEPQLIPGEIRGYRLWRVDAAWAMLRSFRKDVVLPCSSSGAGPYQATCLAPDLHQLKLLLGGRFVPVHADGSPIPDPGCTCGFYATYVGGLGNMLARNGVDMTSVSDLICGAVALSGRVIFGETGVMRGAKMRLEALYQFSGPGYQIPRITAYDRNDLLQDVGRVYKVPTFTSGADFLRAFPQTDLSTLLGAPAYPFMTPEEDAQQIASWETRQHSCWEEVWDQHSYTKRTTKFADRAWRPGLLGNWSTLP